jgi:hypothetical protein
LYHGIFVDDPGTALSLNPYYPLIDIVSDGYCFVRGKVPVHIQEVADWVDDNVRMFWENRPSLQLSGASRVTIGAYLGFGEGLFAATGDLWVESDFSPQQYEAIPELASLSRYCNCGACLSPVERLNCLMLEHCLGLTRQAFCRRYQTCVPTERFDLIIANNLALLHGSIAAGRDRRIEILHFMCDQPIPESYEVWLADLWAAPPRLRHITPE